MSGLEKTSGFLVCRAGDAVPATLRGAVVAIGNFDGVHLGHQRLIGLATEAAGREGRPSAVLTFDPHPRAFFRPDLPHFRLTPEREKLRALAHCGITGVFVRRFDKTLAGMSAAEFVEGLIVRDLAASALVVGADFHFGRGREGTPDVLAQLAARNGLGLTLADTVEQGDEPVSSSRIRTALAEGRIGDANRLLGYRWFVAGEVAHGEKRGRTLGYPTANMALDPACGLAHGIYAVRMAIGPGEVKDGVASFGRRPTFDNGAPLLETYLFDFAGDLYGRDVEVEFVARIRGEERFDSADALVVRMRQDEREAREALRTAARDGVRSIIG